MVAFPERVSPPVKVPVPDPPVAADWLQPPSEGDGVPDAFPVRLVQATLTGFPVGGPWPWPLAKAGKASAASMAGTATAETIRTDTDLRIPCTPRHVREGWRPSLTECTPHFPSCPRVKPPGCHDALAW